MLIEYTIKCIVSIIRGLQRFSVIFELGPLKNLKITENCFLVFNKIGSDRDETKWISKIKYSAYIISKKNILQKSPFPKKKSFSGE